MLDARRARHPRRRAQALRGRLPPGPRRGARHRPDRLRQVDHALRRAQRAQLDREEHHHDRGPGRVPDPGHQPDRVNLKAGLTFAHRPALDPARRPGHHHGRRDPRRRDGQDRHRGRAHRPPRPLHAAHQRRAVGDHAPDRDGHRAVPDRLRARRRRRPATRAPALQLLQAAHGAHRRALKAANFFEAAFDIEAYEPVGCARCSHTGYKGRVGMYEVMTRVGRDPRADDRPRVRRRHPRHRRRSRACACCATTASRRCGSASRPSPRLRVSAAPPTADRGNLMDFDFADVLLEMIELGASDLHLTAGSPPMVPHPRPLRAARLPAADSAGHAARSSTRSSTTTSASGSRRTGRSTSPTRSPARPASASTPSSSARRSAPSCARSRRTSRRSRRSACRRCSMDFIKKPRGFVLVTGPDRLGQVHDARLDDRHDQRGAPRAHHDDRGPDRVPPSPQELHRQPARARAPTPQSFALGLKAALRQDPDVILVGEMRDLETMATALTAAETGHLVFATLHTQDTAADRRPHRRLVPAGAAAPGPRRSSRSRSRASSPSSCCRPPTARAASAPRGARADPGRPQPDPRGQDPPDLLGAPDRRRARHADDGRGARRPRPSPARSPASWPSRARPPPRSSGA